MPPSVQQVFVKVYSMKNHKLRLVQATMTLVRILLNLILRPFPILIVLLWRLIRRGRRSLRVIGRGLAGMRRMCLGRGPIGSRGLRLTCSRLRRAVRLPVLIKRLNCSLNHLKNIQPFLTRWEALLTWKMSNKFLHNKR